jgi:hypothetical protein
MWVYSDLEISADYVRYACERCDAGSQLTQLMLARSREQLEIARMILDQSRTDAPKVWHPRA